MIQLYMKHITLLADACPVLIRLALYMDDIYRP